MRQYVLKAVKDIYKDYNFTKSTFCEPLKGYEGNHVARKLCCSYSHLGYWHAASAWNIYLMNQPLHTKGSWPWGQPGIYYSTFL